MKSVLSVILPQSIFYSRKFAGIKFNFIFFNRQTFKSLYKSLNNYDALLEPGYLKLSKSDLINEDVIFAPDSASSSLGSEPPSVSQGLYARGSSNQDTQHE